MAEREKAQAAAVQENADTSHQMLAGLRVWKTASAYETPAPVDYSLGNWSCSPR